MTERIRVVRKSIYGYPSMDIHMDFLWIFISPKRISMDFLFGNRNFPGLLPEICELKSD